MVDIYIYIFNQISPSIPNLYSTHTVGLYTSLSPSLSLKEDTKKTSMGSLLDEHSSQAGQLRSLEKESDVAAKRSNLLQVKISLQSLDSTG